MKLQCGEYDRKFEVVSKFAQRRREANQLREFAAALKESARSPGVSDVQKLGVLRILDSIERHANYADPLTDVADVIREFDRTRWQWSY